jgi:lysophospholipase L1-like esterase
VKIDVPKRTSFFMEKENVSFHKSLPKWAKLNRIGYFRLREMINLGKGIHYLAFGDSLTVGYGAPPCQGFVSVLQQKVEDAARLPVYLSNAGMNGATTARLLELLDTEPELHQLIRRADVITITAGGNDLIQAALPFIYSGDSTLLISALQAYETNYRKMLARIDKIKGDTVPGGLPYVLILIGLYNPLPEVPESAVWVKRFNHFLDKLHSPKSYVVQIFDAFKGKEAQLLFMDHIHPNAAGYAVIADLVMRTVPPQLWVTKHTVEHK